MRKAWPLVAALVLAALLVPQAVLAAVGSFSSSNATPAVTGVNTMTGTNQAPGGRFACKANGCRAVYATSDGTSSGSYGVFAQAKDPSGRALAGFNIATTGTAIGLSGQSNSSGGRGLNGLALSATGANFGGFLETKSRSTGAAGVFGWASNTSTVEQGAGQNYGVFGRTDGQGEDTSGVRGLATATANDPVTNGVWGDAPSANGTGVYGTSLNGAGMFGIGGAVGSLGIGIALGVAGQSNAVGDGTYGVASFTDFGVTGHVVGTVGNLVGSCRWQASAQDTADCTFTDPFPGSPAPEPVVVIIPRGDPGGYWWLQAFTTDGAGDYSGFTVRRSVAGGETVLNWMVMGTDTNLEPVLPRRFQRERAAFFGR